MYLTLRPVIAIATMLLAACTVRTPYYYGVQGAPDADVAYLWGGNDGAAAMYFTHVDGKQMPSRKLSGYPMSLALGPGTHHVRTLLQKGHKYLYDERDIAMEAGHTYVLRYRDRAAGTRAEISIEDLGTRHCRFDKAGNALSGGTQVVCDPEPAANPS